MKYKAGDRVRVKPKKFFLNHKNKKSDNTISCNTFSYFCIKRMLVYCGRVFIIEDQYNDCFKSYEEDGYYKFKENYFTWQDWMLEGITDDKGNFLLEL